MFAIIEKHRRLSQILLGLVSVTFIGLGAQTFSSGADGQYIGKVGHTAITAEEVKQVSLAARHSGGEADPEAAYRSLVQQAYLELGAEELGVVEPSIDQVRNIIMRDPSFHENGRFSAARFQNYLSQAGIKEDQLINDIRRRYRRQTVVSLLGDGGIVSNSQAERLLALTASEFQLRTVAFNAADHAAKVHPSDAELQAYFAANKAKYALPLAVKLEYIDLSAEELAKQQSVSPQELQDAYRNMEAASDAKPPFEAVKAQLEEKVRQTKAMQTLGNAREQLAQLSFDHPDDLRKVAAEMKLPLQKQEEWVSRPQAEALKLPPAVLEAMFGDEAVGRRLNSEVLDLGGGVSRVLRVTDVSKAREQSFAEAKDAVRKDYAIQEGAKLAQAAAAEALRGAQNGKTAGLAWSQNEKADAAQLQQALGMRNFSAILRARPQNGKPGYAVANLPAGAVLVEVQSVSLPQNAGQQLADARRLLNGRNAEAFYTRYLNVLEQRFPLRSGKQKLSGQDDG